MSKAQSTSDIFYETTASKEVNVSYVGECIMDIHDTAQGLATLCRAGLKDHIFIVEEIGIVLVIIAVLDDMRKKLLEIYPQDSGEPVIREAATRKPGK